VILKHNTLAIRKNLFQKPRKMVEFIKLAKNPRIGFRNAVLLPINLQMKNIATLRFKINSLR
jgi:hypothetical protein